MNNLEPASTGGSDWNIYEVLPDVWSNELVADLEKWQQGHIIENVQATWLMPPGYDEVTGFENESANMAPADHSELATRFAIICSQTCDIGAEKPGDVHPFILLSPLINSEKLSKSTRSLAREGKVGYLFPTNSPDGTALAWYADLRVMFPASKQVLKGRTPIEAFNSEIESLSFGETIAQKFRRPALSNHLSKTLPAALRKFIQDKDRKHTAFRHIEQVRLSITEGERFNPTRGQLFVYVDQELTTEEVLLWQELDLIVKPLMNEVGITMMPLMITSARTQFADIYRSTVPIHCDLLGSASYP